MCRGRNCHFKALEFFQRSDGSKRKKVWNRFCHNEGYPKSRIVEKINCWAVKVNSRKIIQARGCRAVSEAVINICRESVVIIQAKLRAGLEYSVLFLIFRSE
jgi:hypothetical protein